MPEIETPVDSEVKTMCQQSDYDKITNAEVTFQLDESLKLGKVKVVGAYGKFYGC